MINLHLKKIPGLSSKSAPAPKQKPFPTVPGSKRLADARKREADVWSEGAMQVSPSLWRESFPNDDDRLFRSRRCYQELWESINGPGSWAKNPWVFVITFKKL